jgi:uncharacterized protein YdeI (YjbR/CyaY-like superfamily)
MTVVQPRFFRTASAFHDWLEKHHATKTELLVGIHKKGSGKASLTYPEALDEALAFGWIDGVRKSYDADSYTIRFSPRQARSIWSKVNIKRVGELIAAGRMQPAGLAAFERRDEKLSGVYSFEREEAKFGAQELKAFAADAKARVFFDAQPPGYRRLCAFWVMSAKKVETRERRMGLLIAHSRKGERLPPLASPSKSKS